MISEIPNLIVESPPAVVRDGTPRQWMQLYLRFDFLRGQFDFICGEVASLFFKNIFFQGSSCDLQDMWKTCVSYPRRLSVLCLHFPECRMKVLE